MWRELAEGLASVWQCGIIYRRNAPGIAIEKAMTSDWYRVQDDMMRAIHAHKSTMPQPKKKKQQKEQQHESQPKTE